VLNENVPVRRESDPLFVSVRIAAGQLSIKAKLDPLRSVFNDTDGTVAIAWRTETLGGIDLFDADGAPVRRQMETARRAIDFNTGTSSHHQPL